MVDFRRLGATLLLPGALLVAADPPWVASLARVSSLEARFVQRSQSEVFGDMSRTGRIQVARGGRLRVQYDKGLLLICDGRTLVQYDPGARTAHRVPLEAATRDFPLLSLLTDPLSLARHFTLKEEGPGRTTLVPRTKGGIRLEVQHRDALPVAFTWLDATQARQVLTLEGLRQSVSLPAAQFTFTPPKGVRWQ